MRTFEQHEFSKAMLEPQGPEIVDDLAGIRETIEEQDYADTNTLLIKERIERRKRVQEREEDGP